MDPAYKLSKYQKKMQEDVSADKYDICQRKIYKYSKQTNGETKSKNNINLMSYEIIDDKGRLENDIYDIHAKNKMYTHGIFTKIIDNENLLFGEDKNDVLSADGEMVAYDIRLPQSERRELMNKIYLPEAPNIKHIVDNYVPAPFLEETQFLTTETGVPMYNNQDSLKLGERGPTIMEDFHFRQKMRHFDHEQIPERVVHARGSGAYGTFTCTKSMTEFTMADFLQSEGKETPVFVRFSQVVGSKGSTDTVRDARGFATKFYTQEGNFDIVGNNIRLYHCIILYAC